MRKRLILFVMAILSSQPAFPQRTLSLPEAIELALRNNAEMKNSRLEADAATSLRRSALSEYFPEVSAGALLFHSQKHLFELTTPSGNLPVYDGNPINLFRPTQFAYFPGGTTSMLKDVQVGYVDVIQPLFAGGRILYGNQLAAVGRDVARYRVTLSQDEITLSTEEQYWRIVSLDEKKATLQKYDELLNALLRQVQDAYESGLVMRNDVLKVKLKQSDIRQKMSKLDNGRKLAAMAFCRHIGLENDTTLVLNEPWPVIEAPDSYHVDPQVVLASRTEYRLLNKAVQAATLQKRIKRGELLPQAGVGLRTMVVKLDQSDRVRHNVFFGSVSVPLSDWISGTSELKERRAREEIARNNLKDQSERLMLQMEKAWQDFGDSYRQVRLAEESREQAEENVDVNQDSYHNGITGVADLLEAQALLQQTIDQLTDSRAEYMIKRTRYLQVTGR